MWLWSVAAAVSPAGQFHPPTLPTQTLLPGFATLSSNEFTGLTLTAPDGTPVQLDGPPAVGTPHAGWALGALMAMQAGQLLAFWAVFYIALAVTGALRRM